MPKSWIGCAGCWTGIWRVLTGVITRLANRLQRKLLAYQNRAWEFDLEEGLLDAGKLHRVVTQPLSPLSHKQEQDTEFRDTVVTLLLDGWLHAGPADYHRGGDS